jgi:hypothetical protein
MKLGEVSKAFLEASRSPILFDHIDFFSYKNRPVDQMLAAVRSRAQPSLSSACVATRSILPPTIS